MPKRDELSQESEDAIVNLLATRLAEKGHYADVMDGLDDKGRPLVEASLERHAARQRAAGKPGW